MRKVSLSMTVGEAVELGGLLAITGDSSQANGRKELS
jgi:hypothetical protein